MASAYLYPPILDSSMPVFNNDICDIYFTMSKFNNIADVKSMQISIAYQQSGVNAVRKENDPKNAENRRYRKTGIIIVNGHGEPVKNTNLYRIRISANDIVNQKWDIGALYKVQLRFSSIEYEKKEKESQAEWLKNNADKFSEWSTVTSIKPIGKVNIKIPLFNFDSSQINVNEIKEMVFYNTTLEVSGVYSIVEQTTTSEKGVIEHTYSNENLHSYRFKLYDEANNLIEDSLEIMANKYTNSNQFSYFFHTELKPGYRYSLVFSYETEHGFKETYDNFIFSISSIRGYDTSFKIYSVDNIPNGVSFSQNDDSIYRDESEGRIGLRLYDINNTIYNGNICIRRTDNRSNFTKWEDIKIINFIQETLNMKEIFYDYTIESGIWYKYALQELTQTTSGEITRGFMTNTWESPIIRNFEYSYLLGENGQQLKLQYDNDMNSFKLNINESRTDTIGGQFPFITRNGNAKYKVFPVNGLITFNMDEDNIFASENEIYNINSNLSNLKEDVITEYYQDYNEKYSVDANYDYIREHFFREKVLEFLHDGKPKLFKSSTEGNIIVRLMDINSSPVQNLNRLIYKFSSTAYEIAEANLENYIKYKFCNIGNINIDFSTRDVKVGQIIDNFTLSDINNLDESHNIFTKIWEKYDFSKKNIAGYSISIDTVKNLEIEINSEPLVVRNSAGELVSGYNIYNDNKQKITIYNNKRKYVFDSLLTFNKDSKLYFLNADEDYQDALRTTINATINFIYSIIKKPYELKRIKSQSTVIGVGQYYEHTESETSIYNAIHNKYYIDWSSMFTKLINLADIEIEANPKSVFLIRDVNDAAVNEYYHEIGDTGVLNINNIANIKEIKFLGIRQADGTILRKSTDVLINYTYILAKGEYDTNES